VASQYLGSISISRAFRLRRSHAIRVEPEQAECKLFCVRLSGKQRTVFLLRFVEDMDLLEIAAVTGMREGTVKTHLFRALKSVRAALKEQMK
jgi:RNA polymerase sigma factor (sigma-70 family)